FQACLAAEGNADAETGRCQLEIARCKITAAQISGAAVFGETENFRTVQQAGQTGRSPGEFGGTGERGIAKGGGGSKGAAEIGAAQRIKFGNRQPAESELRGDAKPRDPSIAKQAIIACLHDGFLECGFGGKRIGGARAEDVQPEIHAGADGKRGRRRGRAVGGGQAQRANALVGDDLAQGGVGTVDAVDAAGYIQIFVVAAQERMRNEELQRVRGAGGRGVAWARAQITISRGNGGAVVVDGLRFGERGILETADFQRQADCQRG